MDFVKCNKLFVKSREIEDTFLESLWRLQVIGEISKDTSKFEHNYEKYENEKKQNNNKILNNKCEKYNDYYQLFHKCRNIEIDLTGNLYGTRQIATSNTDLLSTVFKTKEATYIKDKINLFNNCYNDLLKIENKYTKYI